MKNVLKAKLAKTSKFLSGVALTVGAGLAHAIDTTKVGASITAAETDALTTGEFVIGSVASLVVIGLIIGIVRKI
ncbi:major capsid protein [Pseudoalteromonas denitrificans]|uniref:Bacteriophage coat protein B n=1 Tax=Pseudoalteromonas denitrificans DSM 6059 TaxID=1123010 RepID=A0A1I1EUT2_9GAMM|nr:major capsid protein [Pseudoalteromonas denitrificans]SFB90442.1 hypothetical protein SAMN02745724_00437 [Pseudoalteromonas denitrificans DSM 6059]